MGKRGHGGAWAPPCPKRKSPIMRGWSRKRGARKKKGIQVAATKRRRGVAQCGMFHCGLSLLPAKAEGGCPSAHVL